MGAGALGRVAWPPMYWRGFATLLTAPLDSGLRRNDDGGGPALTGGAWEGGLASDALEEGLPHPPPPLWIPAFAGMTNGRGRSCGGRHLTRRGAEYRPGV